MRIQPLKLDFQMVLIMKNGGSSFWSSVNFAHGAFF
jgi:hypothetical protein